MKLRNNLKTNSLMCLIELKYTPLFMVVELAIVLHILKDTVSVKIGVTASKFSTLKLKYRKIQCGLV
jgi:hypothetical protein